MTFHPRASRRFVVARPMPSEFPTSSAVCFTLREERLPLRLLGYCPAERSQADSEVWEGTRREPGRDLVREEAARELEREFAKEPAN